jgi:chemotaxis protein CheX
LLEDIHKLAQNIWQTMFAESLEVAEQQTADRSAFLTGSIQITGAWKGVVVFGCPLPLAQSLTGIMLGLETPEDPDICDAVGELTNLTAGAIQALLPAPSELTPPSVAEGKDYKLVFPHCSIVSDVHFRFRSQLLTVSVFEADHDRCTKPGSELRCVLHGQAGRADPIVGRAD